MKKTNRGKTRQETNKRHVEPTQINADEFSQETVKKLKTTPIETNKENCDEFNESFDNNFEPNNDLISFQLTKDLTLKVASVILLTKSFRIVLII